MNSPTPGTLKVSTDVMPRLSIPGGGGVNGVTVCGSNRFGTPFVLTWGPYLIFGSGVTAVAIVTPFSVPPP